MRFKLYERRVSHLLLQRIFLLGLSGVLLVSNLLLAALSFSKSTKIIVSPPDCKQSYWVEGNRFSPSYLEEMALYATHLLLDVTESSIILQGQVLLRWVSPNTYGAFKAKLLEDEERLKREQVSLHFKPAQVEVFPDTLTVHVTGNLMTYVGSKRVVDVQEIYKLKFVSQHDKLLLSSFELLKEEKVSA